MIERGIRGDGVMGKSGWRRCAPAIVALLIVQGGFAQSPKHNYVDMGLMARSPGPNDGQVILAMSLIDAESVNRAGDTVTFDILQLSQLNGKLEARTDRHQVSCGWRSSRSLLSPDDRSVIAAAFDTSQFRQDSFSPLVSPYGLLIDRACAGSPLGAEKGPATVDEATAVWKDYMGKAPSNTLYVSAAPPKPVHADWMDGRRRFVPVSVEDARMNMLFVDRAGAKRRGDIVTGVSLAILGHAAQRNNTPSADVVVLRKVRYDCAEHSMTVLAQAGWSRFGVFATQREKESAKRLETESPVTAAEVAAACRADGKDAKSFSSMEDAWGYARSFWPPRDEPRWASCLWGQYPEAVRTKYLEEWRAHATAPRPVPSNDPGLDRFPPYVREMMSMRDTLPNLPSPAAPVFKSCGVADPQQFAARSAATGFAMQRGAFEFLARQHIDEARFLAAWNEIPWLDRQRIIRTINGYTADDLRFRTAVAGRMADRLGIRSSDQLLLKQLEYAIGGQGRLDGGG
jgi:hypothetical protein